VRALYGPGRLLYAQMLVSEHLKKWAKAALVKPARFYNSEFSYVPRLEMAFARGALNVATRRVDAVRPSSWEFSAFSQNGEDGVIDQLLSLVAVPNRYFIEVGAGDGLENNSSYLAFAKKYNGIMVEGDKAKSNRALQYLQSFNWSVKYLPLFVEPSTVGAILDASLHRAPDFFSLDIDGNDYFVMEALLQQGLRPKVVCVEYNSTFGPDAPLSITYTPELNYRTHHPSQLYYGVSVSGWRVLFHRYGYQFVTVDTRGINAFFVYPSVVALPGDLEPVAFAENATQLHHNGAGWETQFEKIRDQPFLHLAE
jgi:hypothetical protein